MKQVILVTGASGFLGQHVVKLLQEKDTQVKEIRCFDLKPYENKLGKVFCFSFKTHTYTCVYFYVAIFSSN